MIIVITIIALVAYLAAPEGYSRLREIARLTYFAGLLALLIQFGPYLNSFTRGTI